MQTLKNLYRITFILVGWIVLIMVWAFLAFAAFSFVFSIYVALSQ